MKLLVLGGTIFLGRHIVLAAQARGHELSLFTRGRHDPGAFASVERLTGDRDGNLEALRGRQWDAAVDTSGYVPRIVRASAELLSGVVEHYTFISSLSVYADPGQPGTDESGALAKLPEDQADTEAITGESYGPLKALAERAAQEAMPGRALVIRPGLIVGPDDPTDRFTYWPARVARGGEVLAPGRHDAAVQIIDVRDLAEWIVRMIEAGQTGVLNATGPERRLTMGEVLDTCRAVSRSDARLTWVSEEFLLEHNVAPWTELPLWVPEESSWFSEFRSDRAYAAGLTLRPLADTVRATLEWHATRPADHEWRAGMKPEREAALLDEWSRGLE